MRKLIEPIVQQVLINGCLFCTSTRRSQSGAALLQT